MSRSIPSGVNDRAFAVAIGGVGGVLIVLIVAMLIASAMAVRPSDISRALASPEVRYALRLSFLTSCLSTLAALWVAIPLGYLLARYTFPMRGLVDALVDVPIVLPPLVVGVSLLALFRVTIVGQAVERIVPVSFEIPAIVIAQFVVGAAFATRTMRIAFEQLSPRQEAVAMTLGCSRAQAFWRVALPGVRRGVVTAGCLAWARAIGEFGPVLIFAGATRMRTEVAPTTIYLEYQAGNISGALAVAAILLLIALVVIAAARMFGASGGRAERGAP
ncbi:MAG: ABC transporter permease [Phycisphaerales bacterium]|nr:ABC transporter permease [Phycisphaerales bacterium]